jgi:hypothetical protein
MFCTNCGAETKTEHAFCPTCGKSLKLAPVGEQATIPPAKKGIGGGTKVIAGILVVLIGCVAGFLCFSFFKGSPPKAPPIISKDSQIYDKEALRELVLHYTKAWAEAVNKKDFSLAEKYLLPGSELFNSQKELQGNLQKDKVRLQLIKTDIGDISPGSVPGTATINVLEEYNVSSEGKRQVSRCYWTYTANYVQGQGWKLSKLAENAAQRTGFDQPAVVLREYNLEWIQAQYPQLEKLASESAQSRINAILKDQADKFIAGMKSLVDKGKGQPRYDSYQAESSYSVKWLTPDTLSIVCYTYTFTGGAHGSSSEIGYVFDLRTGNLRTLRDKVGDEKIRAYNDTILQQIRAKNIPIFEPYKGIGEKTTYYLENDKTLVVVFQQYEIAPYSSGILRFELPY